MSLSPTASDVKGLELQTPMPGFYGLDDIISVFFLAGGRHVVGGGYNGKIRQWRVDNGREVGKPMCAGDSDVLCLAGSRNGKWIVSGTADGRVTIWNAKTQSRVRQLEAHAHCPIQAVDVSPDGARIVTGSYDSTACIWSLSTGERLLGPLWHDSTLAAVKYSHDGRFLATATNDRHSVRIYDSQSARFLINITIKVDGNDQSLAWSHDNNHLYALSEGNIMCVNVSTGKTISEWPINGDESPRNIVLARNGRFIAASTGNTLSFWDVTAGKQIGPIIEHDGVILSVDISQNYDLVISEFRSTILRRLREILPSIYFDDVYPSCKQENVADEEKDASLEETVKLLLTEVRHLHARQERSYKKIAKLEDTICALRAELVQTQDRDKRAKNDISMGIEALRGTFDELRTEFQLKADRERNGLGSDIESISSDMDEDLMMYSL